MITSKKRAAGFFDSHQKSWIFEERGKKGVKIRQETGNSNEFVLLNKKGQFYLVAAVIIAIIIFSLAAVSNYAKPRERKTAVFDLGNTLNFEAGKAVAYAQMNDNDTWRVIDSFAQTAISSSSGQNIESWFIVYGDPNNITVLTFSNSEVGGVTIDTGVGTIGLIVKQKIITKKTIDYGGSINITFNNLTYKFDMTPGNNFAFLIQEENYVTTSSDVAANPSRSACILAGYNCKESCDNNEEDKNLNCGSDIPVICCGKKNQ